MASVNISKVYLINTPLENDYKHTLYFTGPETQNSYFLSKKVKEYTNVSYQRKDFVIRVPEHIDKLYTCNYVAYQNSNYSDKWFYCFITDMKYINDGCTEIQIETDVLQTWMFDYTVKPSFVEREHVNNDTVGLHTVPECLETGEYVVNNLIVDTDLMDYVYVILVTEAVGDEDGSDKPLATNFGGIFSAGGAYVCKTMKEVVSIIQVFDQSGKSDAVTGVYMIPEKIIEDGDEELRFNGQANPVTYVFNKVPKLNSLNGYTPRNNKVKCYPYTYLLLSNNTGTSNILQYEHFSDSNCQFEVSGSPTIGGSIKCTPLNYKGTPNNFDEGIMCGKFPTLSWSSDLYTNWLTQNAVNIGLGIASSGLTLLGGVGMMATGGGALAGAGAVVSGAMGIANTIGQVHQQSFTPNSAKGNVNGGDINTAMKLNTFFFYGMSIKKEYAEIIDKYFDMFGYKVNMVKIPNKAHRGRWWFTKTIDINIDGALPMKDMQKIKDAYNNGVTFWRNANEIQNYNLTNDVL